MCFGGFGKRKVMIYNSNEPYDLIDMCFFIQAVISIFGILGGPLLGVFTLGILCPFANSKVSPHQSELKKTNQIIEKYFYS